MAAVIGLQRETTEVSEVGRDVDVAVDPIAHLMYYLNCVYSCVPTLDMIPTKLRRHYNYRSLTNEERTQVVILAAILSPDMLMNKLFFEVDEDTDIGGANQFVEIRLAQQTVAAVATENGCVVVDGNRVRVAKIMLYRAEWMIENFIQPLKEAGEKQGILEGSSNSTRRPIAGNSGRPAIAASSASASRSAAAPSSSRPPAAAASSAARPAAAATSRPSASNPPVKAPPQASSQPKAAPTQNKKECAIM